MTATLKNKSRPKWIYPGPKYDIGPTLEMLLPDGLRRAAREQRLQLERMSEVERHQIQVAQRRAARRRDKDDRLRVIKLRSTILSVISEDDLSFYEGQVCSYY